MGPEAKSDLRLLRQVPPVLGGLTWERGLGQLGPSHGAGKPSKPAEEQGAGAALTSGGGGPDHQLQPGWTDPDGLQKAQGHGPTVPPVSLPREFLHLEPGARASWLMVRTRL